MDKKYFHEDQVRELKPGDMIVLAPDPSEGFFDEETVEFVSADFDHHVMYVTSHDNGDFEVGMEQFSRRA